MSIIVKRKSKAAGWLLAAVALISTTHVDADTLPDMFAIDSQPTRNYNFSHEDIDAFDGVIRLSHVDLSIPGNGGLALSITRSYRSDRIAGQTDNASMYGDQSLGPGWSMHFGRLIRRYYSDACGYGQVSSIWDPNSGYNANPPTAHTTKDNPVFELPDGSQKALHYTGASPTMLSTDRWKAECTPSGPIVWSPSGIRYELFQYTNAVMLPAWHVTKIVDRNNNSISIAYAAPGNSRIVSATRSDGATINFTYASAGTVDQRLTSASIAGTTIQYSYSQNFLLRFLLAKVSSLQYPLEAWEYNYTNTINTLLTSGPCTGMGGFHLTSQKFPQGGTTNYSYTCWNLGNTTYGGSQAYTNGACMSAVLPHIGIATKTTSDGGSWTYRHTLGCTEISNLALRKDDVTTITTSTQVATLKFSAIVNQNEPTSGLLRYKDIKTPQGQLLKSESFSWAFQKIGFEYVIRAPGSSPYAYLGVYAPVLTQHTTARDGISHVKTYSNHDAYGNPQTISETGPNGGNRVTNLSYYYNPSLWIVNQVDDETVVGVGSTLRDWDLNGNLLSENRDGVVTSHTRYPTGDIETTTKPGGRVYSYFSYYRGTPQIELQPEGVGLSRIVSDAGNIVSSTNGEGATTKFSYDDWNRVTGITPPIGNITTISYSPNSKTATRGLLQQIVTFDGFGRPTQVATDGVAVSTSYDPYGRKTFSSIAGSTTVGHQYQYDALDRLTRITHTADGSFRTFTYGSSGGVPTVAIQDERGHVTTQAFRAYGDPDDKLLMSIASPVVAASVSMERNGRGLVTSATQGGVTRTFGYDTRYYLVSATHPEVGTTVYGRDAAGNMISKKVGTGGTALFDHDGRNRLWRITYPNGSPSTVTNTYTKTDKLKSVTNAVTTRSYDYDNNQNLIGESLSTGIGMSVTYGYNGNDQLSSITYPILGRTINFNPDVRGRPTTITSPAGAMVSAGFWPNGQLFDLAFVGGSRVTYGQNAREWLSGITVATGDGISRIASTLNYDVAGNLLGVTDTVDATYNRSYGYDPINRLVSATGPWGVGTIGYDGSGNIGTHTLGSTSRSYTYDTLTNRLTSVGTTVAGVSSSVAYTYDLYGNALPGSGAYAFDEASNLTTAGGAIYSYDGTNTRVMTVANGVTTYEFRSAQGLLLAELRLQAGFSNVLKEHIHVNGKEVVEQRTSYRSSLTGTVIDPPTWMFLQHDASGTVLSATAANGSLLFKENYQPYGSQLNGTATAYTQRAFAGQKQDAADRIYMGARYYNPQIGRFLSIDPKEADPSDLHSLNRYAYANNNPHRYVDPDGRTPLDLAFFAVDAVRLGMAIFSGGDVKDAALNLAMSAVGVVSPIPGAGKALQTARAAEAAVIAGKTIENAVGAVAFTGHAAKGPIHHICTNKNCVSAVTGGPWTPRFEAIFNKGGMKLDDALNKIAVPGHKGPHPEAYHQAVFDRLTSATNGLSGSAYNNALQTELRAIGREIQTPGSLLNSLVTKP